ncbi:MAG: TonB-dependent receptor, partial [Acidobacteriota bacterium]|nr:TonB-dependent receptor [Acidobacteriota bacterium]
FPDTAFDFGGGYRIGMPFFIPVIYDDDRIQFNENISKLKGDHSFKAGVEYNDVTSSQTFIGFANGLYKFSSFAGFKNYVEIGPSYVECANDDFSVFSTSNDGTCPAGTGIVGPLLLFLQQAGVGGLTVEQAGTQNIEQTETAVFFQDSWKPTSNMTVDYGLRWEGVDQPEVITPPSEVFFAPFIGQTRDTTLGPMEFPSDGTIPDDMEQWQPRLALAWTPKSDSSKVFRANSGIYHARIPALALASTRSTNGSIGQTLFAASFFRPPSWPDLLPEGAAGDPFFPNVYVFDKNFETPRTWSSAVSWEQEIAPGYAFLAKVNYAKTDHITRWINNNDPLMGCPWASGLGPDGSNGINCAADGGLWTTSSNAKSRYWGVTVGINKRFSDNFAFQAYYTNSEDKSDDDNERDPFTLRYANISNLDAEFGLSDRHQENRFNAWLLWAAPRGINVNVRTTFLDAQPLDINPDGTSVAAFPPSSRCIGGCTVGGDVFRRNQGKKDNEFFTVDVRLSKDFAAGGYTVEPIFEIFNLTDEANFLVPEVTNLIFNFDGTVRSGAGDPRKFQIGVRVVK